MTNLTSAQATALWTGQDTNWSAVGGPSEPVVLIIRPEGSGTRATFKKIVLGGATEATSASVQEDSNGAVAQAVKSTPGSTSVIGFAYYAGNKSGLNGLQLDGIDATLENITNGTYKLQAVGHMYTKGEPTGLTKDFLDFMLSKQVQVDIASTLFYAPGGTPPASNTCAVCEGFDHGRPQRHSSRWSKQPPRPTRPHAQVRRSTFRAGAPAPACRRSPRAPSKWATPTSAPPRNWRRRMRRRWSTTRSSSRAGSWSPTQTSDRPLSQETLTACGRVPAPAANPLRSGPARGPDRSYAFDEGLNGDPGLQPRPLTRSIANGLWQIGWTCHDG